MQQMFLKLHDIEDSEKKDFILETLRREFRDVAIATRKVFERFKGMYNGTKDAPSLSCPHHLKKAQDILVQCIISYCHLL
jgi:hypothetical protein